MWKCKVADLKALAAPVAIKNDEIYRFDMLNGFETFRRRVRYVKAKEVALEIREPIRIKFLPEIEWLS